MNTENQTSPCPIKDVLDVFAGKWKPEILWALKDDSMRFNQLQRAIGDISQRMLSQQLRELQRDGLVKRTQYDTRLPHVEYERTDLAKTLDPIFDALEQWNVDHGPTVHAAREKHPQDN